MRIEKIELIGFKSFADKTVFMLHPGITCIVGPNGCGKSNIVDAFRWVLGEQSAKSLRGEKMEEVIFNGSTLKKPKGMAEVTLVINGLNGPQGDNGQGQDDLITASRRLFRSGESEYMINSNQCRLRDIKDIFLDTGLDFRSYSILEQGRIGEILNSRPLERRFILEEVAGVMKYKVRKAEALSKLESSRNNLTRVNDIVAEIKKQINILDRLAKKAERYKKLSSEMHSIELKIARREFQRLKEIYENVLSELNILREKEAVMKAEIAGIENKTQTRRVGLIENEKEYEVVQRHFLEMEREISDVERSVAICKNDISNIDEYISKILHQEEEADLKTVEMSRKCEDLRFNSTKLSEEIKTHQDALREKTMVLDSIEESVADKEMSLEDKRRGIFRITEELSGLRNDLSKQENSLESLEKRENLNTRDSDNTRKILAEIESSIANVEAEIHRKNNEVLLMKEKKSVLSQELDKNRARLENRTKLFSSAREEVASYMSRLESLEEIVFDRPTRELLSSNENIRLIASISEVFDVDAEYEKAIESALAEKADSFVLESFEDVRTAVFSLREKEIGKTVLIPATIPSLSFDGNVPEGIIGSAIDFVKIKEGYHKIAKNLLGNILIVKELETAYDLRGSDKKYTFVTLDGEILEPSGAVVFGGELGIFRRKREIRELKDMIEAKKSDIEKAQGEIQTIQNQIKETEEEIRNAERSMYDVEKAISLSKMTVENLMEDKERASRKLAYLSIEIDEIIKEKESLKEQINKTEGHIQVVESKRADIEQETVTIQEEIANKKSELDECRSEATDLKLSVASGNEKIDAMKNEMESSERAVKDLKQKKEELGTERETVLAKKSQRAEEILKHEATLRTLVSKADIVRSDISQRKEEIEKESEDLLSVEKELRDLRQRVSEVSSKIAGNDVVRVENKVRLDNLSENIRQNYGFVLENIALEEVTEVEEQRLVELKNKIQEIGPVNLGTLEEYEELRQRYDFLSKQQEDLVKSIAELEEAITKINSTTRRRLREAFEALKAKFSEVFIKLFGGGRAELVLTEENNILETGIDIIAQPPGKKLQNIHLLSGGEKALAALALQFASFLIKPTPLCILDEADAPLDESNTERFTEMLTELSRDTQFIVVTHNKTTMNMAQHLYGITMEEAGISKVISMQLAEA
jgi:chromosome segregation protein